MNQRIAILGLMLLTSFAAAVVSLAQSTPPAATASAAQFEPVYTSDGSFQKGSINQQGKFQTTDLMGVEVHVKDTKRFARFGGWAFFFFPNPAAGPAQPIPASAECYSCHREHGAVDTTFVQFYPTLKAQQRVDTSTSPPKGTDK